MPDDESPSGFHDFTQGTARHVSRNRKQYAAGGGTVGGIVAVLAVLYNMGVIQIPQKPPPPTPAPVPQPTGISSSEKAQWEAITKLREDVSELKTRVAVLEAAN